MEQIVEEADTSGYWLSQVNMEKCGHYMEAIVVGGIG